MLKTPRLRNLIITVVVVLIGLVWYLIARPDRDWLWFLPVFNEEPARIILCRDGEEIVLMPGERAFDDVNAAINQVVRKVRGKESLGISLEAQQEYYDEFSAVEVFYSEPVIIHTIHGFPMADKYLFPQSGVHSDPPVVFAGYQRRPDYREGALVLGSRAALDEAVDRVWAAHGE
jgi:hypothetical protein